ncbi:uncharacterized protein LOC122262264 [Penaeus japonicus]|uniref:uncharacterized protein LOC122262264 n=1 Tax=Penaeus japonicus TaxID=27405 RepID=UPI001C71338A|nr:uncharacterized protein LOC122262264 [Penaeus japonicus]
MCVETENCVCCIGSRLGTVVAASIGLVIGVTVTTLASENLVLLIENGEQTAHYAVYFFFYCFAIAVSLVYTVSSALMMMTAERRVVVVMSVWVGVTVLQMTVLVAYTTVHHCSVGSLVLTGLAVVSLVFLIFVVYSHCRMIRLGYEPV